MVATLKIYTKDKYFYIQSDFNFDNLRISNNNETYLFTKKEASLWSMDSSKIATLLKPNTEDRVNIYYGDQNTQIDTTAFNVFFSEEANLKFQEQLIYLYISMDHKLRFMWNQKPSAKSFYTNSKISNVEIKNEKINLEVVIFSEYMPITKSDLIISNRKTDKKIELHDLSCTYEKNSSNGFKNVANFSFTVPDSFSILLSEYDYNNYDTSIFDFWINFEVSAFPITKPLMRISYSDEIAKELWIPYSKNQMLLLYPYSTVKNNFSLRTGILKKDSYKVYEQLSDTNTPKKDIILISEYPYKAQDNGYFFFKYLMEKQSKYTAYYIITPDSPDLKNLEPFMSNVVFYKSQKHIELLFEATYLAHTHTSSYAFPFISEVFLKQKQNLKKLYLKHGITALKDVSFAYSKKTTPDFTDKIVASSQREKEQMHRQLGYDLTDIEVTGLARFDNLLSKNSNVLSFFKRKKIIIMPTWRNNLNDLSDEDFKKSLFYQKFNDLINDENFQSLAQKKCLKVSLYLHSNFQQYNHLFNSKFVKIIQAGSLSVQSLMKGSGIMITDYSSVGLDFSLLNRTVLFYQFDNDTQEVYEGIKQNHTVLPGPTFQTKEALLINLERKVKNNILDTKYQEIVNKQLYPFKDTNACKRIFDVLDNM